jgi:hypothetical protein
MKNDFETMNNLLSQIMNEMLSLNKIIKIMFTKSIFPSKAKSQGALKKSPDNQSTR